MQPRDIGWIQLNEMGLEAVSTAIMLVPFRPLADDPFPPFIQDSRVVCPKVLMPESVSASLIDG